MKFIHILMLLAAALVCGNSSCQPGDENRLKLPKPTGPYSVGTRNFEVADSSRADLVVITRRRTLVGQMWYPSPINTGFKAPYLDQELLKYLKEQEYYGLDSALYDHLGRVETSALLNTSILPKKLPIVFFIHGLGSPRALHTILFEELASHGYTVIALDHPYGGITVTKNGDILSAAMDTLTSYEGGAILAPVKQWSEDLQFVIRELANPAGSLFPLHQGFLDFENIAVGGHSLGGNIALGIDRYLPRVKGAFNLDGGSFQNIRQGGIAIPSLFLRSYPLYSDEDLETRGRTREGWNEMGKFIDSKFSAVYVSASEKVISIKIKGTAHFSYSDAPYFWSPLVENFGGKLLPEKKVKDLTHRYILAFLDDIFKSGNSLESIPNHEQVIFEVYENHP